MKRQLHHFVGRAVDRLLVIHVRYRWACILLVVGFGTIMVFGAHELGKALFGLGLEQLLLHLGHWTMEEPGAASAISEGADIAENI
jgi:hypothetical protein